MPQTANIDITIQKFRPLGSVVPCTALYALNGNPAFLYLSPPNSKNIVVKKKKNDEEAQINIAFRVDKSTYNLLGIAFTNRDNDIGMLNFPKVEITSDDTRRILTVHDVRDHTANYDYVILVQEVGSGIMGIIDPELDNSEEI